MYAVSRGFVDAMRAARRRVLARVTIDYTDPFGDQSITAEGSETGRISWPAQTFDGITAVPFRWASLDGTWELGADDPWRLAPDTEQGALLYQMGWWGEQVSDGTGAFAQPYPTLTVTHLPRPIDALRLVGDSARGEYAVDFVVELYGEGDVLLHTESVTGNTELDWSLQLPTPVFDVVRQVVTITRWSHPDRVAKVVEFFTSIRETYAEADLVSLQLLEEREASHGSLPVGNIASNQIVVRLVNRNGRFDPDNEASSLRGLLRANRRVQAWLGAEVGSAVEWVPLGTFWSTDWDSPSDAPEAVVRALDRLELLRKSVYRTGAVQQNVTAADLAQTILLDAGLSSDEWVIQPELQTVVFPWAWMPLVAHREALRLVAEAALAVVWCDRDGRIRIGTQPGTPVEAPGVWFLEGSPFPAETMAPTAIYGVGPDDYFLPLQAPSRQDQVANTILVPTRPVIHDTTPVEVYRSPSPVTVPAGGSVSLTVQYSTTPVVTAAASLEGAPAGVSISTFTSFAWGADVVVANSGASPADVTLVVQGEVLREQPGEIVTGSDPVSVAQNGTLAFRYESSHLIQTRAQAEAIAASILASAKDPRRDIEMEWRGQPALELGDLVSVVTDAVRDRRSTYAIVRQQLDWAGVLLARLSGRRIA